MLFFDYKIRKMSPNRNLFGKIPMNDLSTPPTMTTIEIKLNTKFSLKNYNLDPFKTLIFNLRVSIYFW